MDQLKEYFGVFKRQHFWFVAPVLLVLGVVVWFMASKSLTEEFSSNKSTVEGLLSKMRAVSGSEKHPNPEFHEGMQQLIDGRRENVRAAWQTKYDNQKQDLVWPEVTPDFRDAVKDMNPIEKVDFKTQTIQQSLRRSYKRFVDEKLPQLASDIGAKWSPTKARGGSAYRRSREAAADDGGVVDQSQLVIWNPDNQAIIEERFDWPSTPTTLQVLYAQEDIWVLENLIGIIKETNGDVQTRSQAAIKQIAFIQLGSDVEKPSFRVLVPQPMVGNEDGLTEEEMEMEMEVVGGDESGAGGTGFGTEGEGGFDADGNPLPKQDVLASLVANRYVDNNYQPIADLAGLEASAAVAKRIPVRMRLLVDQRSLNRLLIACANSKLTLEVRQLRFNPQGESLGAGKAFGGSGEDRGRATGGFGRQNAETKQLPNYTSFDRMVELYGIVYIFNPVDESKIGNSPEDEFAAM